MIWADSFQLAISPSTCQAREGQLAARHDTSRSSTRFDQLVAASEADADVGFMARLLALCSLPRRNPGHQKE